MPRRDLWGEPITRGDGVGPDFVSPIYATNVSNDPLRAEIARLRPLVSMPQPDVMVDGEWVPLDPGQYDEYQRLNGVAADQALRAAIQSPMWRTTSCSWKVALHRALFGSSISPKWARSYSAMIR